MKYIKKLILTFESKSLEQQYQLEKKNQIQLPIFIFTITLSFISNFVVLGFHFFNSKIETWYLNIAFSITTLLLFIFIVIMKKHQYLQDAITLSNLILGFLEFNVDPATSNYIEFYSYGNTFMQLQAVLYIVSNFNHATLQVIFHFVLRIAITILLSKRTDYLLIFIGLTSSVIILVTIFYKEKSSRKLFIQNLKENNWENNISFIIQKPYFRINYQQEQLLFNLIKDNKIEQFPGYDNFYCDGCNVRKLLRCYFIDKNLTLEEYLRNQKNHISQKLILTFKKRKFILKLCTLDIQQIQYLFILDEISIQFKKEEDKKVKQNDLIEFLRSNKAFSYQHFFNWGAQSLLFLNSKIIKKINLQELMIQLLHIFKQHVFHQIQVKIITYDQNTSIYTFYYQIKIFMMQLFEVLSMIQRNNNLQNQIILKRKGCDILIKITNLDLETFEQMFEKNFFLKNLQTLLLHEIEIYEGIQLHFRNYPIKSFAFDI
ncbi:unnamed protein product (macronuclear) [Paramecium tetraurelia]|uniref:Transmembrane protein n=1 Tax=Paramecium tetraurelia TaxID=5888 RepID=A0BUX8_PARTE|nr:uncharacterized protein GSPATT00005591001 [Paramecium tetraurelia]CAK62345.1 unnamed protein product [Paramecium tetraurelia]|eukprot:XP_001429743.1 hypothetical protein (macronuclear) [Paramecium tetraurelia strain d4-2]